MEGADRPTRFDPEPESSSSIPLTIIAQDPSVTAGGAVLRSLVSLPPERLEPGPRSSRFWVVDYDTTSRRIVAPVPDPDRDAIASAPDDRLATDPAIRAQNVFVVASRTLQRFESALGRRLRWGFPGHQLFLVPAAFAEANAFYDPDAFAVLFGYFEPAPDDTAEAAAPGTAEAPAAEAPGAPAEAPGAPPATVYTSLSHDIVAHETTHAILDGLRNRFEEPSLPDQAAFHEALADIVALMSVFALRETVLALIPGDPVTGLVSQTQASRGALARTALLGLAEQFGAALRVHGGDALRRSVLLAAEPSRLSDPTFNEPHARGEVLVAAVTNAMLDIWTGRLKDAHAEGTPLHRTRVAEEGSKAADHILTMCIRAIDYLPPVDLSFNDFATALLAADEEVVPDDRHDYRGILTKAFKRYGIKETRPRKVNTFARRDAPTYRLIHEDELRIRLDEAFRWIWHNAAPLGVCLDYYLAVEAVTPCTRVAPDGFVVNEVVVTYIQKLDGTIAELRDLARQRGGELIVPSGVSDTTRLEMLGGGTLIFDEFGRLRYHQPKPLLDWDRQSRRLDYLVRYGLRDTRGRLGYSLGTPLGQRFAVMHAERPETRGEAW